MSTNTTTPERPADTTASSHPSAPTPEQIADAKRRLDLAIERIMKGIRDPEAGRQADQEMDRMREETWKRIGTVEVAVDLIREARDA